MTPASAWNQETSAAPLRCPAKYRGEVWGQVGESRQKTLGSATHGVHRSEGSAHLVGFSLDQLQRVGACLTPSMYLGPGSWSYLGDITNVFAFLFVYFGLYDTGFYFVALAHYVAQAGLQFKTVQVVGLHQSWLLFLFNSVSMCQELEHGRVGRAYSSAAQWSIAQGDDLPSWESVFFFRKCSCHTDVVTATMPLSRSNTPCSLMGLCSHTDWRWDLNP